MFQFTQKVSFSHSDENGELRLGSVIDSFQDCSQLHSEESGVSVERLWKMNAGWQIISWQIVVNRYPKFGEEVIVGTWPSGIRGVAANRNYIMDTVDGERLVYANSIWTLVNLEKHRVMPISKEIAACYEYEPPLEMEKVSRKVKLPENLEHLDTVLIPRRSKDTNGHMNNSYYVHFAGEFLPEDRKVKQLRVEYRSGSYAGEFLELTGGWSDGKYYVAFQGPENAEDLRAGLEFTFFD